jgi:hypothetical protein
MYQPSPSSGQPAGPLRPPAPAPALTAVKLMHAGAAVRAIGLITGLALIIVDIKAAARGQFLGHSLTAQKALVMTVWIVFGLAAIALWLWMARANGQGRNWARILSTVLFGQATLQLPGGFTQPVSHPGSARRCCTTAAPRCSSWPGCSALLLCGCSGARPPARSSSGRASRRLCRVRCEQC